MTWIKYISDEAHYNEALSRVHFKILVFDGVLAYVGSANLTGAGIGMKGTSRRNFEAGILTDSPGLVQAAMNHFDSVWAGFRCKGGGAGEGNS